MGDEIILSESLVPEDYQVPGDVDDPVPLLPPSQGYHQNIIALSILLCVALITNLPAFPVILFRRTRSVS